MNKNSQSVKYHHICIIGNGEDWNSGKIKEYCKYWEKLTGQKVKEAGLYFTSINKWVKI